MGLKNKYYMKYYALMHFTMLRNKNYNDLHFKQMVIFNNNEHKIL